MLNREPPMSATATHDNTELKGMIELILANRDAQAAAEEVRRADEAIANPLVPATPPVDIADIMGKHLAAMNAPRSKVMRITAPSGAVYHGEVSDQAQGPEPSQEAAPMEAAPDDAAQTGDMQ